MKATGITRQIDGLGRIVLPKELRNSFEINTNDALEIYTEDDKIILRKLQRTCVFCGSKENTEEFCGKAVCVKCVDKLIKYSAIMKEEN